jgi:hypothetical protein
MQEPATNFRHAEKQDGAHVDGFPDQPANDTLQYP